MARVTVEDCVIKVPNRFELVLLAAKRARDLASGVTETVERENDKNPVVALREIAEETIDIEELKNDMILGLQKYVYADEPEDETTTILAAAEKEWADVMTEPSVNKIGDADAADAAALQSDGKDDAVVDDGGKSTPTTGELDPVAPPAAVESTD